MSNGLTFKNIHSFNTFGLAMKSVSRPLLAPRNDNYIDIPKRDGSILIPGAKGDVPIEVRFALKASNLQELREYAKQIGVWLDSTKRERLQFDDEPNQYWMGKVANQIDIPEIVTLLTEFTVIFRCSPNPIDI